MSFKTPMTVESHRFLQEELFRFKGEERTKIVRAIEEARAHGDLSENAEYDAAKNAQGLLEGRIRDIESKLATAQVVDISTLSGDKVIFGATVRLSEVESREEREVMIVGEDEANIEKGMISFSSPLARALIGKRVDDTAKVHLPHGEKEYDILEIKFGR